MKEINTNTQYYEGHKYRIYPTEEQKQKLDRFIDLYRYVYNWAMAKEKNIYEFYQYGESEKAIYSYYDLTVMYTEYRNLPENEWLLELPVGTSRKALKTVVYAYQLYFKGVNGLPKFKSRKEPTQSFSTRDERFYIYNNCIRMEGFDCITIDLGFDCGFDQNTIVINPTVTRDVFRDYYISFNTIEDKIEVDNSEGPVIGIDLGVRNTFTTSVPINGSNYNTEPLDEIRKIKRTIQKKQPQISQDIQRRLEEAEENGLKYEDIPKSNREIKREERVNTLKRKVHNIKNTYYDTTIKQIMDTNPKAVVMETLSVRDMQHEELSKYINPYLIDTSFYSIIQKTKYQCNKRNIPFIQAPRDYPSTQMCSTCGAINNIGRNKIYRCPNCGNVIDRDLNASYNLENYYYETTGEKRIVAKVVK